MSNSEIPASTVANLDEELSFRDLALSLWNRRRFIALVTVSGMVLSFVYGMYAPKEFQSTALLLPTDPPRTDQLGAAAALLAKKGSGTSDVDLYQGLLTSRTVLSQLLTSPIHNLSDTAKGRIEPLFKVLQIDTAKPLSVFNTVNGLARRVNVNSKSTEPGGIVTVSVTARTAWLARDINRNVLEIGQEEIRRVRAERSSAIRARLRETVTQARQDWDSSTEAVTRFQEENRSSLLPRQLLELERLQLDKQAFQQTYLQARRDFDQEGLDRSKAAPPMVILDSANLPPRKSKPKRGAILVLGTFAFFLVGCGAAHVRNLIAQAKSEA